MKSIAVAPAKVILTGEHFVVYGVPALVSAVDIYSKTAVSTRRDTTIVARSSSPRCAISINGEHTRVLEGERNARKMLEPMIRVAQAALNRFGSRNQGLNIRIDSEIPVGVGLGSSAAVAISTIAAVGKLCKRRLYRETIRQLAFGSERLIHKIPSGIDQTISTFGGVIVYQKEKPFRRISPRQIFPIIVGDTGKRRSTGKMVSKVRTLLAERDVFAKRALRSAGIISRSALAALRCGDLKRLGQLMNQNHELLREIEISTTELDRLVSAAREAGAFGAKLTGAGGGGCMIAVASSDCTSSVLQAIGHAGGTPYLARMEHRGVRSWLIN